jgi:flagellar biosynthesis/type III secretory pathway protein FliH
MTLERNERALVELVEHACTQRRREILAAAQHEADALRRDAHAEARRAMRRAFAAERQLTRERIEVAQAHLDTRERLAAQQRSKALAAAALQLLPEALAARWREPAQRAAWIGQALANAFEVLPRGTWRVAHPADLADAERVRLAAAVAERTGAAPQLQSDPRIDAGLVIATDGASIDATLAGLAADREDIAARLLDRIAKLEAEASQHATAAGAPP